MKPFILTALLCCCTTAVASEPNPAIDMNGHLRLAQEAARHRDSRRVTEDEFLRMSGEPGTLILDCRSRDKFDLLHVRGAVHLSFPDITVESLNRVIPDKNTRVLIYCNNNFFNEEQAFPSKVKAAALNLSTYISLYTYGYRNVYELGPRVDPKQAKLKLVSSEKLENVSGPRKASSARVGRPSGR